jgi:hypothetical protein
MAWREDYQRETNGMRFMLVVVAAAKYPVS